VAAVENAATSILSEFFDFVKGAFELVVGFFEGDATEDISRALEVMGDALIAEIVLAAFSSLRESADLALMTFAVRDIVKANITKENKAVMLILLHRITNRNTTSAGGGHNQFDATTTATNTTIAVGEASSFVENYFSDDAEDSSYVEDSSSTTTGGENAFQKIGDALGQWWKDKVENGFSTLKEVRANFSESELAVSINDTFSQLMESPLGEDLFSPLGGKVDFVDTVAIFLFFLTAKQVRDDYFVFRDVVSDVLGQAGAVGKVILKIAALYHVVKGAVDAKKEYCPHCPRTPWLNQCTGLPLLAEQTNHASYMVDEGHPSILFQEGVCNSQVLAKFPESQNSQKSCSWSTESKCQPYIDHDATHCSYINVTTRYPFSDITHPLVAPDGIAACEGAVDSEGQNACRVSTDNKTCARIIRASRAPQVCPTLKNEDECNSAYQTNNDNDNDKSCRWHSYIVGSHGFCYPINILSAQCSNITDDKVAENKNAL
jgi:hypothetical protein